MGSRLTHSLEVQQVGRHTVKEIFYHFKNDGRIGALGLSQLEAPCESMVEMACLMHDIGNPLFGHFGAVAINDWFRRRLDITGLEQDALGNDRCQVVSLRLRASDEDNNALRSRIRLDLCHFEGNAQAIRMGHSLLKLNLTYAQVG